MIFGSPDAKNNMSLDREVSRLRWFQNRFGWMTFGSPDAKNNMSITGTIASNSTGFEWHPGPGAKSNVSPQRLTSFAHFSGPSAKKDLTLRRLPQTS